MFFAAYLINPFFVVAIPFIALLIYFRKSSATIKVVLFNVIALLILAGVFDVVFTTKFVFPYNNFRENSTYFHHGTKPSRTELTKWFSEYTIHTNSLGFFDASQRNVSLKKNGKRFVFMGDSFVEGVGEPWENTFPGIVSKELEKENIELLNAGCISYSPKIYYLKMKYFLEKGLEMDDLFVFIDISDVQDEIEYAYFKPSERVLFLSDINLFFFQNSFIYRYFKERMSYWQENPRHKDSPFWEGKFYQVRQLWSMDKHHYEKWGKEGLDLSKTHMDKLFKLTQKYGVKLHVAVFPWREHILKKDLGSIQVLFWRKFCEERGIDFINFFPDFINVEDPEAKEKLWFVNEDVHWSKAGLKKMADSVSAYFRKKGVLKPETH